MILNPYKQVVQNFFSSILLETFREIDIEYSIFYVFHYTFSIFLNASLL